MVRIGSRFSRLAPPAAARAFFAAAFLGGACLTGLALSGCDLIISDRIASLPQGASWQALPMRALVAQSTIHVDAIELCTVARCGYEAAVGQFSAEGEDAVRLQAILSQPRRLAELLREPDRDRGRKDKRAPVDVSVQETSVNGWSGLTISMDGGERHRHVRGLAVSRRDGDRLTAVVVVSPLDAVSLRLAEAAVRQP